MSVDPIAINFSGGGAPVSAPAAPAPQPPSVTNVSRLAKQNGLSFENAEVATSVVKISGSVVVDLVTTETVSLDDRIRLVGDFRVVKVNHIVGKNGEVIREQVLAPCDDLVPVPWDPSNTADNGILRARP